MTENWTHGFGDENGNEWESLTVLNEDSEFLTVLMQNKQIINICQFTSVHDRFYVTCLYGNYDISVEFAERIYELIMGEEESDN